MIIVHAMQSIGIDRLNVRPLANYTRNHHAALARPGRVHAERREGRECTNPVDKVVDIAAIAAVAVKGAGHGDIVAAERFDDVLVEHLVKGVTDISIEGDVQGAKRAAVAARLEPSDKWFNNQRH